ncbi:winged helix-turn-helix domain-containing protein [Streptomyces chiangmaiensis]|uniref:Winged helix-turn-helix domain-containing protein n=1 Tax=Streptomyces chiangmaiensis TaxID=766497 RepID=A0ABU7FM00_9ACTN|nr:winged helix-turn-helix domain-containing protein [Streptomyces chiangmaiensis]MED7824965.1 winged helix-turn-helix domain-containing protein [Streptomyces chiangmaiensis]
MTDLPKYRYEELADQIQEEVRSGKLPKGAALPGERAMTEIYGVAIGTVRRAVRLLRDRGVVATLPAKGTFVLGAGGTEGDTSES